MRLKDYLAMGVGHVWLFDPVERVAYTYTNTALKLAEVNRLAIANSPIYLDLPEIFTALD